MADPIDELEVLVSLDLGPLEDDLQEAVDKFERLDDQTTRDAQDELDDAAGAADDLSDSLEEADRKEIDVDVHAGELSQVEWRLEAFDGRSVEVDVDVDRDQLQDELEDATDAADDLSDSLEEADRKDIDVDVHDGELSQLQRRLEAFDGRSVEVDVDVDRDVGDVDGGPGRRGGLISALPHEVEEAGRALSALTSSVSASTAAIAGLGTAAAALGATAASLNVAATAAAGGLTALATKLALEYGGEELSRDLKAVKAQFEETASLFVEAFEPIIRGTVIPILQTFNKWLRSNIDELKALATRHIPQMQEAAGTIIFLGEAAGNLISAFERLGVIDWFLGQIQRLAAAMQGLANLIDSITGGPEQPNTSAENDPSVQAPRMGPDEKVGGAPTPNRRGDPSRAALGAGKLGDIMNPLAKQIGRIRERFRQGLIDKQEMLRQIVSARESAFQELQKLGQKMPSIVSDGLISHLASEIKAAQKKLDKLGKEVSLPELNLKGASKAPTAGDVASSSLSQNVQQAPIQGMGGGLSALQSAAEGAGSIEEINSLIQATRQQFDTLSNKEAQAFIGRLQKMRSEMKENQAEAAAIGDALARSVARSADRLFQKFGQSISEAIFGGGSGPGEAQSKLQLFNAKEQMRSLKESLRQGQISHREFSLRMQAQKKKIQKRQEQLNDAMKSGFAKAADSMLGAFKQVAKQLIAEITAVIAKMLVLKGLTAALNISSGGFGGAVISNLGGSAFLEGGASGGMVKESGLAVIHEDEQIINAETVGMMQDLIANVQSFTQPVMPNAQSAIASATGGQLKVQNDVQITGELRGRGPDLVASFRQALSEEATVGGPGSL